MIASTATVSATAHRGCFINQGCQRCLIRQGCLRIATFPPFAEVKIWEQVKGGQDDEETIELGSITSYAPSYATLRALRQQQRSALSECSSATQNHIR